MGINALIRVESLSKNCNRLYKLFGGTNVKPFVQGPRASINLISLLLLILAITSIYAGYLVLDVDNITGIAFILVGVILAARPSIQLVRLIRTVPFHNPQLHTHFDRQKVRPRSDSDRGPTIH